MTIRALKRGSYRSTPGPHYGTPKEVWGFRTRPQRAPAVALARAFLSGNAGLFKLAPGLAGLGPPRVVRSLGATHVIFGQVHLGQRVHRAYVTVHIDLAGRVYYSKNRFVPHSRLPGRLAPGIDRADAIRRARRTLPSPLRDARVAGVERMWFPDKDRLVQAWKVRLVRDAPREAWIVYLDAVTGRRLSRYDNVAEAGKTGRAHVFDPSPVTALGDHALLFTPSKRVRRPPPVAYREVALEGLDGRGALDGARVSTALTRNRIRRPDLDFRMGSHQRGFEEVMVYHHLDAAMRYLESLGYRGPRRIFDGPVKANATGTRDDNSWYDPTDRTLTFGTGAIDDAEDAETILHEFGHAIQDAICPDFGQSAEAAAMGEAFGDYFAASYFEARKPARYRNSVMSWDGLLLGLADGADPPCLRRLDSTLTYADFEEDGDEHDNGPIWSSALWQVRALLGREAADRVIIESHFQLDGFTTFARGARAILDADRHLEGGRHVAELTRLFKRRGFKPL